ncbi:uncharacterized protein BDZ99DRAFT_216759 [Mytilinidion resinicola]|uniref:Uncharacterized protein n=1 Tax=Mytilinidion resinicola TaxID=574789 RepID=A0A6A6XZB2_9PEZI|nr:uncharacterized protein BDZ99DRAFT_216759 [Mytilinidion resinicola]KAF2801739.1 hypothetical protein BDZ99DRAFT_216759 [Mytilinidion resinicola]
MLCLNLPLRFGAGPFEGDRLVSTCACGHPTRPSSRYLQFRLGPSYSGMDIVVNAAPRRRPGRR